ncbi:MAG TPA: spermidine/putrescine ABC transporter permease, partial [Treponema sp.]|nr:spermidine/putrescine ABC transporter permease [Treponema sp.]
MRPPAAQRKNKINQGALYSWPMGLWFIVFFIAPLVIITIYSFLKKGVYGGVEPQFTLRAYE